MDDGPQHNEDENPDWDTFLDQLPEPTLNDDFLHFLHSDNDAVLAPADDHHCSPNTVLSEIENFLFADEDDVVPATPSFEADYDKLLAEILVDEPPQPPRGDSDDGSSPSDRVGAVTPEEDAAEEDAADEQLNKKQRR